MTRLRTILLITATAAFFACYAPELTAEAGEHPTINEITITGNTLIPTATILHRLPYRRSGSFDQTQSTRAINAIYNLGAFEQVIIEKELRDDGTVDLFINITEKPALAAVVFEGNKGLSTKKLEEIIDLKNLHAINQETADLLAVKIRKEYQASDYHDADVVATVTKDPENPQRASLLFAIDEKVKSHIRHIDFIGNTIIPSRLLRNSIQNREVWLFGFLNGAGKFDDSALELDRERVRAAYANRGYFGARVTDVQVTRTPGDSAIDLLFTISEGPCFTVKEIDIAPDAAVPHRIVRHLLTLKPGDTYKQSEIHKMMESIKKLYGEYGFIDAYVSPQVIPDTATNTISITFHVEKGSQWRLNRVLITGNQLTKDAVIRRQFVLEEGGPITSTAMEISKNNVERLGYFDREQEGVEWKKHRLDKDLLDLELAVKEIPTRSFNIGVDFGASQADQNGGLKGVISADLRNMFGHGWDTGFKISGGKGNFGEFALHVSDPYITNNLSGYMSISYRKTLYDQWKWIVPSPREEVIGAIGRLGTLLPTPDRCTRMYVESGVERISNNAYDTSTGTPQKKFEIRGADVRDKPRLESLVNQKLQAGTLQWVGLDIVKDTRNHPAYPNDGYHIAFANKCALPGINKTFSFYKSTLEASWYTPLIGYDSLVLGLHAKIGAVEQIGLGETTLSKIPYRELFHIGGMESVRGFNQSQVGPSWEYANPLGGKKMVQMNAELIFPFMSNRNMRVHLFYDCGCAWDTPKTEIIRDNMQRIKHDNFHLRHTIGVGLNILQPQPIKVSFGYKLDRNKRIGETPHEFHIGMNSAF